VGKHPQSWHSYLPGLHLTNALLLPEFSPGAQRVLPRCTGPACVNPEESSIFSPASHSLYLPLTTFQKKTTALWLKNPWSGQVPPKLKAVARYLPGRDRPDARPR